MDYGRFGDCGMPNEQGKLYQEEFHEDGGGRKELVSGSGEQETD